MTFDAIDRCLKWSSLRVNTLSLTHTEGEQHPPMSNRCSCRTDGLGLHLELGLPVSVAVDVPDPLGWATNLDPIAVARAVVCAESVLIAKIMISSGGSSVNIIKTQAAKQKTKY